MAFLNLQVFLNSESESQSVLASDFCKFARCGGVDSKRGVVLFCFVCLSKFVNQIFR